jgi:hypothetical protein
MLKANSQLCVAAIVRRAVKTLQFDDRIDIDILLSLVPTLTERDRYPIGSELNRLCKEGCLEFVARAAHGKHQYRVVKSPIDRMERRRPIFRSRIETPSPPPPEPTQATLDEAMAAATEPPPLPPDEPTTPFGDQMVKISEAVANLQGEVKKAMVLGFAERGLDLEDCDDEALWAELLRRKKAAP